METSKETTRHIIVHRRRTPLRRLKRLVTRVCLLAALLFLVAALLVDVLHPRVLTPPAVAALASLLRNGSAPSPDLLTAAGIASLHARDDEGTVIAGNPPTLTTRRLLFWTPVESLTLVTYPASHPIVHPAAPVTLSLHPLTPLSITPLRAATGTRLPRFTPFVVHPAQPARVLEHADGFLPARALQGAVYQAAVTLHARVLWDALVDTSTLLAGYSARCSASRDAGGILVYAKRIADVVKHRRAQRLNASQGAS